MRVGYLIEGSISVPEGSVFLEGVKNQIILPDGKVISVQPIVEMATEKDADDHKNLNYEEARDIGVLMEDYQRVSYEFVDMIVPELETS